MSVCEALSGDEQKPETKGYSDDCPNVGLATSFEPNLMTGNTLQANCIIGNKGGAARDPKAWRYDEATHFSAGGTHHSCAVARARLDLQGTADTYDVAWCANVKDGVSPPQDEVMALGSMTFSNAKFLPTSATVWFAVDLGKVQPIVQLVFQPRRNINAENNQYPRTVRIWRSCDRDGEAWDPIVNPMGAIPTGSGATTVAEKSITCRKAVGTNTTAALDNKVWSDCMFDFPVFGGGTTFNDRIRLGGSSYESVVNLMPPVGTSRSSGGSPATSSVVPVLARHLRVYPVRWNKFPSFRMEVVGGFGSERPKKNDPSSYVSRELLQPFTNAGGQMSLSERTAANGNPSFENLVNKGLAGSNRNARALQPKDAEVIWRNLDFYETENMDFHTTSVLLDFLIGDLSSAKSQKNALKRRTTMEAGGGQCIVPD